jgi:hypothetical protein
VGFARNALIAGVVLAILAAVKLWFFQHRPLLTD